MLPGDACLQSRHLNNTLVKGFFLAYVMKSSCAPRHYSDCRVTSCLHFVQLCSYSTTSVCPWWKFRMCRRPLIQTLVHFVGLACTARAHWQSLLESASFVCSRSAFFFFWCINIYWVHLGISPRSYGYTVNLSENASVWVCPSSRVCCQKENAQVRHSLSTVCLSSRADGNHGLMSERDTEVNFQTVTCGVVQFTYSSD